MKSTKREQSGDHVDDRRGLPNLPQLPDDIIPSILCFLPTKEYAQASLLSKACFQAWCTRPNLDLDYNFFKSEGKLRAKNQKAFLKFADKTMLEYHAHNHASITKFRLVMSLTYKVPVSMIDKWIEKAVECAVEKMELQFVSVRNVAYSLPQRLFEAKSLRELIVVRGILERQTVGRLIMWHNLHRLELQRVFLQNALFDHIVSCCHSIEYLKVDLCEGLSRISVINVNRTLKEFHVHQRFVDEVEVDAPAVKKVEIRIENCRSHVSHVGFKLCTYENLKHLTLYRVRITDELFCEFINKYPSIEHLEIGYCLGLKRLQISSSSLKSVILTSRKGLVIDFDVPSINLLKYTGPIPCLSFTSASQKWVSEVNIDCAYDPSASWFLKFRKLLIQLAGSYLSFSVRFEIKVYFPINELRSNGLEFPKLEFDTILVYTEFIYAPSAKNSTVLDGIFWISQPKNLFLDWHMGTDLITNDKRIEFVKFNYDQLVTERHPENQNLQETKYWQRDLKQVKVEFLIKESGNLWQVQPLEWEALAKNSWQAEIMRLCFNLEWGNIFRRNELSITEDVYMGNILKLFENNYEIIQGDQCSSQKKLPCAEIH